jgi:hypothetical protein
MATRDVESFKFCAREFTAGDIHLIQDVVATYRNLTRHELAQTVCELLEWRRANGGAKWRECLDLLVKLEGMGAVELPALRETKPRGARTRVPRTARGEPGEPVVGTVRDVAPVELCVVKREDDRLLWRELVGRHHYLGHKVPFGAHLRYLIRSEGGEGQVMGCLQLSSPAWRVAPRDEWIGWDDRTRERGLQRIVNNSRFLILPWVQVRNLASHVLSLLQRKLPKDWAQAYGVEVVLMETFVDSRRFRGTCYRASNWTWLGVTQGRGRMDRDKSRLGAEAKEIFVRPVARRTRQRLRRGE